MGKLKKGSRAILDTLTLGMTKKPKMPDPPPVIPVPDEEEIARQRRRKAVLRSGGRASTVLTGNETFGP